MGVKAGAWGGAFSPSFDAAYDPAVTAALPGDPDPCAWPLDTACLTEDWDTLDPSVQARSQALAGATLRRLTGYRVGGCPITVRPCTQGCLSSTVRPSYLDMLGTYGSGFFPHIEGGVWVNSCGCLRNCSCSQLCEVELPAPVGVVYEVKVDGAVVPDTDYRVDRNILVWVGADPCPWPVCQDMKAADTEPGTFSVTYLNSYPVDSLGAYAGGILAMEYAKACIGSTKCRLPAGVTAVTRQGISMEISAGSFPDGFTGIREVDAFITLWNPKPIRQAPQVWSPDLHAPRVVRS